MSKTAIGVAVATIAALSVTQSAHADMAKAVELHKSGDLTAALEEYVSTGGEGNAEASFRAAQMFERGDGTPEPRLEKAAAWYQVAARAGHLPALTALAEMFADGRGVPEDKIQAWALFDIAARKGLIEAATKRDRLAQDMTEAEYEAGPRRAEKLAPKYFQ